MHDNAISADQVRARAGVALPEARAAVYMQNAKLAGWTMAEFQERTRMSSRDARALAYRFAIEFQDFDPLAPPVELAWRKVKKGWELQNGSEVLGTCLRAKDGGYAAEVFDIRTEFASSSRLAMARASALIDAKSPSVFGGQPVHVRLIDRTGAAETLFPKLDETFHACRKAFDA